jgi:uncharacterized protein
MMHEDYRERIYRRGMQTEGMQCFHVVEMESDLFISAAADLTQDALKALKKARKTIHAYSRGNPLFLPSLIPLADDRKASPLIREMLQAGNRAQVGPMAAVAGAVAEFVGKKLLPFSPEIMVENGGDIFLASQRPVTIRIFTDNPLFSDRICIRIREHLFPLGVCTSSGKIGPSLSFGAADAATVMASSTALADAAATALGNLVRNEDDIPPALETINKIEGILGALVIIGEKIGAWGAVELAG